MNAIILAGGFGSRLAPLTDDCPKPMLTVANRPVLDYVTAQLYAHGIRDFVFSLGYLAQKVKNHVSAYRGVNAKYVVETQPLGTAGGVKLAENLLSDTFIVSSGDALSDLDYTALIYSHYSSRADVTMAVTSAPDPRAYGVAQLGSGGRISGFIEKPDSNEYGNLVNAGVYVIEKRVLDYVPRGVKFDFSRDLFPALVESGRVNAYVHPGYWCDVGDKTSYFKANFFMSEGGFHPFIPAFNEQAYATTPKSGGTVSASAVTVGRYSDSIIGRGARIASSADIKNCVVLGGALVTGRHTYSIIGENFVEKLPSMGEITPKIMQITEKNLQTGV